MSILKELSHLESSALYLLKLDGQVMGIRAKVYSVDTNKFSYYDFSINEIKTPDLREFLNSNKSKFKDLELYEYNNLFVTKDEIENNIVIKEFKDYDIMVNVINFFKRIYL